MLLRVLVLMSVLCFSSFAFADETKTPETETSKSDVKSEGKSPGKDRAEMEEIVVTATRTEKEVESAPGSVSVVTKKDIETRDIKTIDQALNDVPGVFDRRSKGIMDTLSSIALRGIPGQNRTLILVDGITFNDAYTGGVNYGGFAPEDVQRIEVVRGPFSSLYGGYAMGGVVNIITKMPETREVTLKSGYGSGWERGAAMDDLWSAYASYGDRIKDKLSLFVSYGYKTTNGYPTDFNVQKTQPPAGITGAIPTTDNLGNPRFLIGDKGDNTWKDYNATVKVGYDFSKVTRLILTFINNGYKYDYDDPHTLLRDSSGNEVFSYKNGSSTVKEASFLGGMGQKQQSLYNLRFETEIATVKTALSLGLVDQYKYWYVSPSSTGSAKLSGGPDTISSTPSKAYTADLQFSVPLFTRHIFTFGGSFKQGSADTTVNNLSDWREQGSVTSLSSESGGKDRTYAVFLQDEIMILNNLTLFLGLREDWWSTFDGFADQPGAAGFPKNFESRDASSFSPKAAIVYKPFETTTVRTSVGKAFRAPTIYELYRTWVSTSGVTYASNPGLKPETTVSWDIGVEQKLWQGAKVGATYFENNLRDLIYLKMVSSTLQEYINAAKATSKGVEIEAEQRIDKNFRAFANFTYTDAKIEKNDAKPSTNGKRLTYMPEKMFNVGGEFEKGPFSTSLVGRYVGKRFSNDDNSDRVNNVYTSRDPYFTADAKVSYMITKFAKVSLAMNNIFDRDYFDYYKAPGRSWFGELTLKF